MPTESPRVNHNSGPPSLGQQSQPGSRLPAHPTQHIQYGQINPNRVPPHQQPIQHAHSRPISSNSMPFAGMPPRQIPMNQQPPGAPLQQQQPGRVPPQYFPNSYVTSDYTTAIPPNASYMNPPFLYSHQFYPVQPPSGPPPHPSSAQQNHAPMNGRSQRNFHQPVHPSHQMPRGPAPNPIPIPRRAKKVIQIVDPKTNQAIKVEKATTSSAVPNTKPAPSNFKIEPRAARPLSLESDPADSKSLQSLKTDKGSVSEREGESSIAEKQEKAAEDDKKSELNVSEGKNEVEAHKPASVKTPDTSSKSTVGDIDEKDSGVSTKPTERISSVEAVATSDVVQESPVDTAVSKEVPGDQSRVVQSESYDQMDKTSSINKPDDNLDGMTSDVSSSTFADVRSDSTDGPLPNLTSKTSDEPQPSTVKSVTETVKEVSNSASNPPVSQVSNTIKPENAETKKEKPSVTPSETKENSSKLAHGNNGLNSTPVKVDDKTEHVADDGDENMDDSSNGVDDETANGSKVTEVDGEDDSFGPAMVFKSGERRVYPPAWTVTMRAFANLKKAAEILPTMGNQIRKDSGMKRSASRDNHVSRINSRSLNKDPRRAFPTPSSFQMPTIRGPLPVGNTNIGKDDLRSARSQSPPKLKPQGSNRDEMRGFRSQGSGRTGRHGGPVRSTHPPVDPFIQPAEKLKRSENAWKRDRDTEDETTKKVMEVRSLLNKLTLEKFDKIFQQIVSIDISSMKTLIGIVQEIFEKPLYEPKFSSMYAELCKRLDQTVQPILDMKGAEEGFNFRKILLNNCKDEFIRFANSNANREVGSGKDSKTENKDSKTDTSEHKGQSASEKEEEEMKATRAKRRMLANVRFIGELYLKDLLKETIIHKNCIQKLLNLAAKNYEEDVLEAVCKLISKTGSKLSSNAEAVEHINKYFLVLVNMSKDSRVPARIRFMIQDLVDQRSNGWKVRREEVGAKTIAEIHKDIAEKEKAKHEAANALRDRKQRSQSARMHNDRGGSGSQPRITMTMASVNKGQSSGMSRTNMMLERVNRTSASASAPPPLPSMRLGPGGKSSLGGSTGPSLRPGSMGGSGSRFSLLQSDTQDRSNVSALSSGSSAVSGGSDRRTKLVPNNKSGLSRRSHSTRSSFPDLSTVQPPPVVELMDIAALKKKTKTILEEYLEINDYGEFTGCMEEEVKSPNYPSFAELLIKFTMEGKLDRIPKIQNLFVKLIKDGKLSASLFLNGFKKYGPELSNIEMDFPLATELYSGALAAVASTAEFVQLGENGEFGVGFIRKIFESTTEKNGAAKLVLMVCNAIMHYEKKEKGEVSAKAHAQEVLKSLDIDISAEMYAWDSVFGPKLLNNILTKNDAFFLIPTFKFEMELRSVLEGEVSDESVSKILNSSKLDLENKEVGLKAISVSIRIGLDRVFCDESGVKGKLDSILKECVCKALLKKFMIKGDDSNGIPRAHQLEAVYAVQAYVALNPSKFSADTQSGTAVFMVLYDTELVEEEVFRFWKKDAGVSLKRSGKEKLLKDTSSFFKWLDEAEEE